MRQFLTCFPPLLLLKPPLRGPNSIVDANPSSQYTLLIWFDSTAMGFGSSSVNRECYFKEDKADEVYTEVPTLSNG
eukprot:scaffold840_cov257-Chaetoceros_neogracile.AAC.7